MPFVLLLSSQPETLRDLEDLLFRGGYDTLVAPLLEEAPSRLLTRPDVIIVDLSSGMSLDWQPLASSAQSASPPPILAAITVDQIEDFDQPLPITDFFLWPERPGEALARVRWVLWKHSRLDPRHTIRAGDLLIDTANYRVLLRETPVELTPKEYQLLYYLATHSDRVLSRDLLLNEVWGRDYVGGVRTVDVHIRRLRSKLEDHNHTFIDTVRNAGYRFRFQ
jgi:DNA-binding response OmpR family regulator